MNAPEIRVKGERIEGDLAQLKEFNSGDTGITRLSLGPEEERAVKYLESGMKAAGLEVTRDPMGNVFARRAGAKDLPSVMLGSHLDSVVEGGNFDGALGVVAALEVVRSLNDMGAETRRPVEIAIFRLEESAAFGKSCIGSRAFAGTLKPGDLDRLTNRDGTPLREALLAVGGDPDDLEGVIRDPASLDSFLELHIEQADNLDQKGIPVGIVTAIAAPTRFRIRIAGQAAHSGSMPMDRRRDALCAASEVVLAVERLAAAENAETVGTVGSLTVDPGLMTVVPGRVELLVDIRDVDSSRKDRVAASLQEEVDEISARRGVTAEVDLTGKDEPVATSPRLVETLADAAKARGVPCQKMHSAAAHDAAHVAGVAEAGMVFVRSYGGSHNPNEWADMDDIVSASEVLLEATLRLARA